MPSSCFVVVASRLNLGFSATKCKSEPCIAVNIYVFVLLTFDRTTHAVLLACACSHADEDDKDENEEKENLHDCCLVALLIG